MSRKVPPHPKELRAEAIRLVLEQGLSLREASQRLAVAKIIFGETRKTHLAKTLVMLNQ